MAKRKTENWKQKNVVFFGFWDDSPILKNRFARMVRNLKKTFGQTRLRRRDVIALAFDALDEKLGTVDGAEPTNKQGDTK